MKGVTIFRDERRNRRVLQVDIKEIAKNPSQFEDLMDILVAESRKDEKSVEWSEVKNNLKKKGKL